jgi:phage gp16-like protein
MTLSRQQIALIKIATKDRGLTDDEYRSALAQIGGVTSSRDLDPEGFSAMMGYFEYIGFAPTAAKGANYGPRDGMASFAQMELIRSLWSEITRRSYTGEDEFNKWLLAKFKVSSLRFLKQDTARKVITALMMWKKRLRAAA